MLIEPLASSLAECAPDGDAARPLFDSCERYMVQAAAHNVPETHARVLDLMGVEPARHSYCARGSTVDFVAVTPRDGATRDRT